MIWDPPDGGGWSMMGQGFTWAMAAVVILVLVTLVLLAGVVAAQLLRGSDRRPNRHLEPQRESEPEAVLKLRLARGEISLEEFVKVRSAVTGK
jgi:uncharacterized membrane protein